MQFPVSIVVDERTGVFQCSWLFAVVTSEWTSLSCLATATAAVVFQGGDDTRGKVGQTLLAAASGQLFLDGPHTKNMT